MVSMSSPVYLAIVSDDKPSAFILRADPLHRFLFCRQKYGKELEVPNFLAKFLKLSTKSPKFYAFIAVVNVAGYDSDVRVEWSLYQKKTA